LAGAVLLASRAVTTISPSLEEGEGREVFALRQNDGVAFVGSYVLGDGFILEPEEVSHFLATIEHSDEIILPYINGVEFNSSPS
jgi:hypothetical protein